jgi:hypothetical protein
MHKVTRHAFSPLPTHFPSFNSEIQPPNEQQTVHLLYLLRLNSCRFGTASCKISQLNCRVNNQGYQPVRISHKIPGHHNSPAVLKSHLTCPIIKETNRTDTVPPTATTPAHQQTTSRQTWKGRNYSTYQKRNVHGMIENIIKRIELSLWLVKLPQYWSSAASWTGCSTNQIHLLIMVITIALSVRG